MTRTSEYMADLFAYDLERLRIKYGSKAPKDKWSHESLKRYYSKKAGIPMERLRNEPPKTRSELESLSAEFAKAGVALTSEELGKATRAGFHVGYIKNSEGEIEYTKPLPHVDFGGTSLEREAPENPFVSQAAPVRISPSRRRAPLRDHRKLVVFSDAQIDYRRIDGQLVPIHDERALEIVRMLCKEEQPDEIINLGDTVDLAALSHFDPDSNHFFNSIQPSFDRAHRMYAELRADNPNAKITEVDSNHNTRLAKFVLKQAMDFYGFKRPGEEPEEWPVLTYPYLANLNKVGVDWVSGYGAAEYQYGDDKDLVFIHGNTVASNGSTALRISKQYPDVNIVQGHGHRLERHTRTTRAGKYLTALMLPALCKNTGEVPGYHSSVDDRGKVVHYQENWQQGAVIVNDYGDGNYEYQEMLINNGRAFHNGKEYESSKETE